MVTPFDDDGALDLPAAVELARWLAAHGSDGLVLSGSTGESSVLTDEEKVALWRAVAEAVTIPVIAGTGSNDTAHSVAMTKRAAASAASTACSWSRRTTTGPPRPASTSTSGRWPRRRATFPSCSTTSPSGAGRRIATPTMLRLAREVPGDRGAQGRRRRPSHARRTWRRRCPRASRSTAATTS